MQKLDIKFVYHALTAQEKERVIALWINTNILSLVEAKRRVDEVSSLILCEGEVVGVSTVYLAKPYGSEKQYYFGRMFISPEYRGDNSARTRLKQLNFSQLKELHRGDAYGLFLELENQKLAHLGEKTDYMSKRGYTYYGKSQRGLQLWYVDFDNPKGIFKQG